MTKEEKVGLQKQIGSRICIAREVVGITQAELSRRVGLGRSQITNIELGNSDVTATMLVNISRALGVKTMRLLP